MVQTSLDWFKSYFEWHLSTLMVLRHLLALLRVGIDPQGFVFGPQLLFIFEAPLSKIGRNDNLLSHFYADDMQIYIDAAVEYFEQCVTEIRI